MKRVLVANRGEIALRIIRGCHEESLDAVAVYSDADAESRHVREADAAVHIGGNAPADSYLRIERIVEAAKASGADAVHPGYGFLSERAEFAQAVAEAKLTWIGPPAAAIAAMGDKTAARKRMRVAGVPVVPGTQDALASAEEAIKAAKTAGYPVLLKAAAGGGGRGMRVVRGAADMAAEFEAASNEAAKAFGDGRIYLERFLERPRHIEIQVLADHHGRVVHLGERECSIQRRHQKLIEEAPSVAVTPAIRRAMGEAAVRAAQAVGYVSAGTCEFLLMPNGEFYFLEMNTRLQVEHPVTELVYGVDLVRMQLKIAQHHHLSLPEKAMIPRGWAMECRITAEDPASDFLPASGKVTGVRLPEGPGVRWDGWIEAGTEVSLFYDSLLGKLIVWGESRERAIARMRRALKDLVVAGLPTSKEFHQRVMDEPEFARGEIDIGYWDRLGKSLMAAPPSREALEKMAAAAALAEDEKRKAGGQAVGRSDKPEGPGGGWGAEGRRENLR